MPKATNTIDKAFSLLRDGKKHEGVEVLYREYYAKMYGIAISVLKNENDSRDAVHNLMARLMSMQTEEYPKSGELSWLYTVLRNEALALLKKNNRLLPLDDSVAFDEGYEDENINALMDMDKYQRMIGRLDPDRQSVVTLKVLCGFTHREIADILGKPIGTVQWLYATAIARLKASVPILFIISLLSSVAVIRRLLPDQEAPPVDNPGDSGVPPGAEPVDILVLILVILILFCIGRLIFTYVKGLKFSKKRKNK